MAVTQGQAPGSSPPLPYAGRASIARRLLEEHPDWSDRLIALAAGLSPKSVAVIRQKAPSGALQPGKRLGRDGRRRPVTALEGRKRAAQYFAARPGAALREVAREADVSVGTAQDVRAQLLRGLDPLTPGRTRPRPEPAPAPAGPVTCPAPAVIPARTVPAVWPQLMPKLAGDPGLRYSDSGRAFLRWMTASMTGLARWREFAGSLPAHRAAEVSAVAEQAAKEWFDFAEHLRSCQALSDAGHRP